MGFLQVMGFKRIPCLGIHMKVDGKMGELMGMECFIGRMGIVMKGVGNADFSMGMES
jgi:hypothetical protein